MKGCRARPPCCSTKVLCGLGKGLAGSAKLDDAAVERAVSAVRRFIAVGHQARVTATHILATAAAREAVNGPQFIARIEAIANTKVHVLSGAEEAQYSAWGVKSGFYNPEGIVGDMGGGSLELVGINGEIEGGLTLPLGGLRLRDAAGGSIEKAKGIVKDALKKAEIAWPTQARNFYAVGGTWRSLFKLHIANSHYPINIIHDYEVEAGRFIAFCDRIVSRDIESVAGIDSVSRNRRELLSYGALLLGQIVRKIGATRVVASSLGVREGFLYTLLPPQERQLDSLIEAARDLSVLRSRSPMHGEELADFTAHAFEAFGIEESEEEARWRIATCYLADIGWRSRSPEQ